MTAPAALWSPEMATQARNLHANLVLDTGVPWKEKMEPWQKEVFASVLGLPDAPSLERQQLWIEGPTGSGKDQIIAAVVLAILRVAPQGFEVVCWSSDLDRCRDVIKTVRGFIRRTDAAAEDAGQPKWLGHGIEFTRDEIRYLDRGVRVLVESLDGYSASGARGDMFILNEVQSWPDPQGTRVWDEAIARYDKITHGRFVVFSNAPFSPPGDFRRDQRDKAQAGGPESPWWWKGVTLEECPWWTPEKLERKRRSVAPHVYRRLYLCLPTDGRGELVHPDLIRAAISPDWFAQAEPAPGVRYFHGLDIGVVRDHAVHLILHRTRADWRIWLDAIRVWIPQPGRSVDLDQVEAHVLDEMRRWPGKLFADPYQAVQMVQRLERKGHNVTQVPFSAENLTQMCEAVRSAFHDRRIVLFPDAGKVYIRDQITTSLERQVLDAEVVETEKGTRIKSRRNQQGHGDQLSALALALWGLTKSAAAGPPVAVGSPKTKDAPPARRAFEGRRWLTRHAGRFLGVRVPERSATR